MKIQIVLSKRLWQSKFFLRFALILTTAAFFSVVFAVHSKLATNETELFHQNQTELFGNITQNKQRLLNRQPLVESHTLVGSYYSLRNNLTATLMLNNKGAEPLEAIPVFYSANGTQLQLAPLVVNTASYQDFDLQ
jgi:hypothetical protein